MSSSTRVWGVNVTLRLARIARGGRLTAEEAAADTAHIRHLVFVVQPKYTTKVEHY